MTITVTICNLKIESFLCYNVQQFVVWKSSNFLNDLSQLGKNHTRVLEIMTFHHLNYRVRNLFTTNTQDANYGSWVWKSEWNAVDNLRIDDHDCHIYIRTIYIRYIRCKQSWRRCTKCCGESALAWGETQVRGSNGSCGDDDDAEMCPPWCCST